MKAPAAVRIVILAGAIGLAGCTAIPSPPPPTVAGSSALSVSDRLYCGRNIPRGGEDSDDAWAQFLAEIVTPGCPAGFAVVRGEGQWRGQSGTIVRERTFILERNHADTAPEEQAVRDIITE